MFGPCSQRTHYALASRGRQLTRGRGRYRKRPSDPAAGRFLPLSWKGRIGHVHHVFLVLRSCAALGYGRAVGLQTESHSKADCYHCAWYCNTLITRRWSLWQNAECDACVRSCGNHWRENYLIITGYLFVEGWAQMSYRYPAEKVRNSDNLSWQFRTGAQFKPEWVFNRRISMKPLLCFFLFAKRNCRVRSSEIDRKLSKVLWFYWSFPLWSARLKASKSMTFERQKTYLHTQCAVIVVLRFNVCESSWRFMEFLITWKDGQVYFKNFFTKSGIEMEMELKKSKFLPNLFVKRQNDIKTLFLKTPTKSSALINLMKLQFFSKMLQGSCWITANAQR